MTTLTDRYVWGVLRAVPEPQRAELEPEIRAMVDDAVEARAAQTGVNREADDAVERAALIELGDPELLAARYTGRSMVLIGPRLFLTWRRLLVILLPIVVPFSALGVVVAQSLAGQTDVRALVGSGVSVAYNVAIQLVFWFTLVFALVDRAGDKSLDIGWTPDQLPALPTTGRLSAVELALSMAALVFAGVFIVWQQVAPADRDRRHRLPVFDPALWSFWLPWFLAVIALEVVFTALLYRAGRWTWPFAVVNALLAAAFAVPAFWLLQSDHLWNPAAVTALQGAGYGGAVAPMGTVIIAISILVISALGRRRRVPQGLPCRTQPACTGRPDRWWRGRRRGGRGIGQERSPATGPRLWCACVGWGQDAEGRVPSVTSRVIVWPSRRTVRWAVWPGASWLITRSSGCSASSVWPLTAVMMSPALRPAASAGPPGTIAGCAAACPNGSWPCAKGSWAERRCPGRRCPGRRCRRARRRSGSTRRCRPGRPAALA